MEVAISRRPLGQERELREQDRKYNRVAPLAVQRTKYLLDTPDHFIHEQKATGKDRRQKTRDEKKALFLQINVTGKEEGHQWTPKRSGLECAQCQCRIHQHMSIQQLRNAKEEKCELAQSLPVKGGEPQLETKQAFIKRILEHREPDGHELTIQNHYLVCGKCGLRTLRNSAGERT